jgi:transposase
MMGQLPAGQTALFYDFCLDNYISQDHFLRQIDRILDLSKLRRHLAPYYSHTGRPSIDPELLIRMLIIAYCFGIRSERRLCEEVHLNLAYRWFCRLGLEEQVPEHSIFSKNRHGRFRESDTLRFVFEQVLGHCIAKGLVGGEGFAVDASIIAADANRQRGVRRDEVIDWGETTAVTRPVREYLNRLDEDNGYKTPPKQVSLTDPAAQWTAARGGPAYFAYSTNYLIDIDAGIIVDVEATAAHRTDEVNATRTMIDRTEERFKLKPNRLIGDTAYGTAEMLEWMVKEKAITPHIPVWDKSGRTDGSFSRTDFIFDDKANEYCCPQGKPLRTTGRVTVDNTRLYRASYYDCINCPDKYRCCPNTPSRKIARSVHEAARDSARALAKTPEYQQSMKDRKKVEMLFAHLKQILKLDRLRLRGLSGAHDEFLLAATAQNLRRMAKWCGHDPPNTAIGVTV